MDLITLVTACTLAVDPKLMHALIWQQSGGEPWAIAVQGESNPRVYPSMHVAIGETRKMPAGNVVRVGLAGVPLLPKKVSASVLLPCRNVAMAAVRIANFASRCKAHPQFKTDPSLCSVAVYRGSWEQPDVGVVATVREGDAPNFDMPRGTRTESFDVAGNHDADSEPFVIDITSTFAEQARGWWSALFPTKSKPSGEQSERSAAATPPVAEPPVSASPAPFLFKGNSQDRHLFVRRVGTERP